MLAISGLVIGFIVLIKGAGFLVEGASALAKRLRVPDLVIGLTVVSFGTSIAELFVNIFASVGHNSDIVIGNILGSNIVNVLLILGISCMIHPLKVTDNTIWKEIPLSLLAALLFIVVVNDRLIDQSGVSILSRIDGIVMLMFFVIFLHYTFALAKDHRKLFEEQPIKTDSVFKSVLWIVIGLGALILGAKWVVDGAVRLAVLFHVSQSLIGLTIVAVGTSLPELATSTVAAYKKNSDIAVGNIVGSNIFNIFFILGVSGLIHPVAYNTVNNFDAVVCVLSSLLMFVFMFTGKKKVFDRGEGAVLVILYLCYISFLVIRG